MPDICHGGTPSILGGADGGLLLPLGGDAEAGLDPLVKSVIYLLSLMWFLVGVWLATDTLMTAIECITSRTRFTTDPKTGRDTPTQVWTSTRANLALAAVGCCAPEVLLGLTELFHGNMNSGELAPSTVVGSAGFNLLVVAGVCILCVPGGELRRINEVPYFLVTSAFAVLAPVWIFVVVAYMSPDVVEWWEGLTTLCLFPVVVQLAHLAAVGCRGSESKLLEEEVAPVLVPGSSRADVDEMTTRIRQKYGKKSEAHMTALLEHEFAPKQLSWARARIQATRLWTGGRRELPRAVAAEAARAELAAQLAGANDCGRRDEQAGVSVISFVSKHWVVQEADQSVRVVVHRSGDCAQALHVPYETRDGTAKGGQDYAHEQGTLLFGPGEQERVVLLSILDDRRSVQADEFYLDLSPPSSTDAYQLGEVPQATVTIADADGPGVISFASDSHTLFEPSERGEVSIEVLRRGGVNGNVLCHYRTVEQSATAGRDYVEKCGSLLFHDGQACAEIRLEILPKGRCEAADTFLLVLEDPSGGATLDPTTNGGSDKCICQVCLAASQEKQERLDALYDALCSEWELASVGTTCWSQQFYEAILPLGTRDGLLQAGLSDWALHGLALPWKLLAAFVPPSSICGGWLRLCSSLILLAALVVVVGDLARLLACSLEVEASALAVTLLAVGMSLPDLGASKLLAVHSESADSALGRVAGSSAVRVFLGAGLPWTIGSLYWLSVDVDLNDITDPWVSEGRLKGWWNEYPHVKRNNPGSFVVTSGYLGLSAGVLACCALLSSASLVARRFCVGGELGGPSALRWPATVYFCFLWLFFVGASCMASGA